MGISLNASVIGSVAAGGAIGAVARTVMIQAATGMSVSYPYGTLLVNLTGSLLIGIFWALSHQFHWMHELRPLIALGILGGFTTFSAFSLDLFILIEHQRFSTATIYFLLSNLGSLAALAVGFLAVKRFISG